MNNGKYTSHTLKYGLFLSKGFPEFPLNVPDTVNKENSANLPNIHSKEDVKVPEYIDEKTRKEDEAHLINKCDLISEDKIDHDGNESNNQDSTDDEESDNVNKVERNSQQKEQEAEESGSSDSSKRTSLLSGSDLPQDSMKDTPETDESGKSSKSPTTGMFTVHILRLYLTC